MFHQWVALCTFTPSQAGDYYLQVRTNVALGGTRGRPGRLKGNPTVYNQTGDDTSVHGSGNNRFALRVKGAPRGLGLGGRLAAHVDLRQLLGRQHDVQPGPGDPGRGDQDARTSASTTSATPPTPARSSVLPPTDSNMSSPITGCIGSGVVNGRPDQLPAEQRQHRLGVERQVAVRPHPDPRHLHVQRPTNRWLLVPPAGSFPGGVSDTTTWTAQITETRSD